MEKLKPTHISRKKIIKEKLKVNAHINKITNRIMKKLKPAHISKRWSLKLFLKKLKPTYQQNKC